MAERSGTGIIVLGGVAVVLYLGYKKFVKPYAAIPVPAGSYLKRVLIVIQNPKLKGDVFSFDLVFNNPNTQQMIIKSIVGQMYVNGAPVGMVQHYGTDVLKPNAQTKIDIAVKLQALPVIQIFLQSLTGKMKNQTITFKGEANINDTPLPITENLKIS